MKALIMEAIKLVIEKINMPIFSPIPSWILFKSLINNTSFTKLKFDRLLSKCHILCNSTGKII